MDRNVALTMIFTVCILGPCAVFAASAFASINSLGRNPSAASKIFIAMIVALSFAEATAFIAMIIVFQLFS
jgi:F0F1-type ATP synthase membrane subunit c/vacuolar-type H+-ATPase subunit K